MKPLALLLSLLALSGCADFSRYVEPSTRPSAAQGLAWCDYWTPAKGLIVLSNDGQTYQDRAGEWWVRGGWAHEDVLYERAQFAGVFAGMRER